MPRSTVLFLVVLVTLTAGSSAALADEDGEVGAEHADEVEQEADDEVSPDNIERAQELFDEGAKSFYRGDYDQAAVEFRRAHQHHPHPLFLYNFALATIRLDQLQEASRAAREAEAMDESLPPEQNARNRAIIDSSTVVFDARDRTDAIDEARQVAEADDEPTEVDAPPETEESTFGTTGWIGTGTLLAGTGAIVAGSLAHYGLHIHREEFERRQGLYDDSDGMAELRDEIDRRETHRNLLMGSGVGLVALGAGLVVWEMGSGDETAESTADISLTPGGGTVSIHW